MLVSDIGEIEALVKSMNPTSDTLTMVTSTVSPDEIIKFGVMASNRNASLASGRLVKAAEIFFARLLSIGISAYGSGGARSTTRLSSLLSPKIAFVVGPVPGMIAQPLKPRPKITTLTVARNKLITQKNVTVSK